MQCRGSSMKVWNDVLPLTLNSHVCAVCHAGRLADIDASIEKGFTGMNVYNVFSFCSVRFVPRTSSILFSVHKSRFLAT